LAKWLDEKGIYFALCQQKNLYFQEKTGLEYQVLKNQGFKPGMLSLSLAHAVFILNSKFRPAVRY
jgi:hypothetical protein